MWNSHLTKCKLCFGPLPIIDDNQICLSCEEKHDISSDDSPRVNEELFFLKSENERLKKQLSLKSILEEKRLLENEFTPQLIEEYKKREKIYESKITELQDENEKLQKELDSEIKNEIERKESLLQQLEIGNKKLEIEQKEAPKYDRIAQLSQPKNPLKKGEAFQLLPSAKDKKNLPKKKN